MHFSPVLFIAVTAVASAQLVDVTINSTPPGAAIEIEHMRFGRTPATLKIRPGDYRIVLALNQHEPWAQKVKVREGLPNVVNADLAAKLMPTQQNESFRAKPPIVTTDGSTPTSLAPMTVVVSEQDQEPELVVGTVPPPARRPISWHRVKYTVEGPGEAMLTIRNDRGQTEQGIVALPWSYNAQFPEGSFLYVSAQKRDRLVRVGRDRPLYDIDRDALIQSAIELDGVPFLSAESHMPFGIAMVSGRIVE